MCFFFKFIIQSCKLCFAVFLFKSFFQNIVCKHGILREKRTVKVGCKCVVIRNSFICFASVTSVAVYYFAKWWVFILSNSAVVIFESYNCTARKITFQYYIAGESFFGIITVYVQNSCSFNNFFAQFV